MIHWKQIQLESGKTITTSEKGNSMVPIIMSGQEHILEPVNIEDCKVGDIVFCKVKGFYFTHLVTAIDIKKGLQISNNRGKINGWTKQVYGKVIKIN